MAINSLGREFEEEDAPEESKKVQDTKQQEPETQQLPEATQEWLQDNQWFFEDSTMKAVALSINDELIQQGLDPTSEDFYTKVDERLLEEIPHKFEVDDEDDAEKEEEVKPKKTAKKKAKPTQVVG